MSERHGTGEGKEAVLRRELAEAIAIRTAAAAKHAEKLSKLKSG